MERGSGEMRVVRGQRSRRPFKWLALQGAPPPRGASRASVPKRLGRRGRPLRAAKTCRCGTSEFENHRVGWLCSDGSSCVIKPTSELGSTSHTLPHAVEPIDSDRAAKPWGI